MLFFVSFGFIIFLSSVSNGADVGRCGNAGGCAVGEEDGLQRASGEMQQLQTMLEVRCNTEVSFKIETIGNRAKSCR